MSAEQHRRYFPGLSTLSGSAVEPWRRIRIFLPRKLDRSRPGEVKQYVSGVTELWGRLSESYDIRTAYDRAVKKGDPYLSPHGLFRRLQPGDNFHAVEFLEKFGPLTHPWSLGEIPLNKGRDPFKNERHFIAKHVPRHVPTTRPRITFNEVIDTVRVDLKEFWAMHAKFRLIAQLYESRDDKKGLIQAWREFYDNRPRDWVVLGPGHFGDLERSGFRYQRSEALALVELELNHQMADCSVRWEPTDRSRESWRLSIRMHSLWSVIWELFASDAARVPWRLCPHCQRVFYPPRRDRFYCTTRQQTLASKRKYSRRYRRREARGRVRSVRKFSRRKEARR